MHSTLPDNSHFDFMRSLKVFVLLEVVRMLVEVSFVQ